jgi:hypothetical protein
VSDQPSQSSSRAVTDTPTVTDAPQALSRDELADYEQLRKLISPKTSLDLLDGFAKWVFSAAAIVGTLGAGFGVSGANDLQGTGRTTFAWAVACLGFSLALAALARLPLPSRVNRYSEVSLARHLEHVLIVRGSLLAVSACCLAFGLILAGLSPLFS